MSYKNIVRELIVGKTIDSFDWVEGLSTEVIKIGIGNGEHIEIYKDDNDCLAIEHWTPQGQSHNV